MFFVCLVRGLGLFLQGHYQITVLLLVCRVFVVQWQDMGAEGHSNVALNGTV